MTIDVFFSLSFHNLIINFLVISKPLSIKIAPIIDSHKSPRIFFFQICCFFEICLNLKIDLILN